MKKKTMNDIAKEAQVSKATISRVLSHPEKVKTTTRKKILDIMEKYSYIPNQMAQGLAGSSTKTIGVVIDELSNYFFIELAEGVDSVISSCDYSMQLSSSRWVLEREKKIVRSLISSQVDGILLAPVSSDSESIEIVQKSGIPFIVVNCKPKDDYVAYVGCDNFNGGQLAAQFIKQHPMEQTIMVTGFKHESLHDRISGFSHYLKDYENFKHYPDINTFEDGFKLLPILINRDKIDRIKTNLFITNDNVAIGLIHALAEKNINIPEQVSVIGYDNIRLSGFSRIPLTTISQSIRDMGRIAAYELLEMIKDREKKGPKHLIKPELIVRKSTRTF